MATKIKNKPVQKTLTVQDKQKAALNKKALIIIQKLEATHIRQDYIAEKMGVSSSTLSRFMAAKDGYITRAIVDKASDFMARAIAGTLDE